MIDFTRFNPESDVILIDKPYTWTSFNVVGKIKSGLKYLHKKKIKVGHAGTLDPLAIGLLLVCVGNATKKIEEFQAQEKEYTGTFMLGATTPCFDMEKPVDQSFPYEHITREMAEQVIKASFSGEIEQTPPLFSAVKIDGKRAFNYARQGETVELRPKKIQISCFEITRFELPEIDFLIRCSKGTYIRSIARDFGACLNSGAYLSALRRTAIGSFSVTGVLQLVEENCSRVELLERFVTSKKRPSV